MSNNTISLERYKIISAPRATKSIRDNFSSQIDFNNYNKTSFPDIEKEALLIRCLLLLRDLFYLDKDALIEASDNLKDIFIYHQESSTYEVSRLNNVNRIIIGEISETETIKPPATFDFSL